MKTNGENKQSDITSIPLKRLEWACRRGMLELDLMLMTFLNEKYSKLSSDQQALFADLLAQPDPDLFAWLLGNQPPAMQFTSLINQIRQCQHIVSK